MKKNILIVLAMLAASAYGQGTIYDAPETNPRHDLGMKFCWTFNEATVAPKDWSGTGFDANTFNSQPHIMTNGVFYHDGLNKDGVAYRDVNGTVVVGDVIGSDSSGTIFTFGYSATRTGGAGSSGSHLDMTDSIPSQTHQVWLAGYFTATAYFGPYSLFYNYNSVDRIYYTAATPSVWENKWYSITWISTGSTDVYYKNGSTPPPGTKTIGQGSSTGRWCHDLSTKMTGIFIGAAYKASGASVIWQDLSQGYASVAMYYSTQLSASYIAELNEYCWANERADK